jgi:hypothetical protein
MDGGYGRHGFDQQPHCEVLVGKRVRSVHEDDAVQSPSPQRLGLGQTLETKPQRRLSAGWQSQGLQRHQERTLRSDGADKRRALQLQMSPKATPRLAWFHRTMPLTG